MSFDDFLLSNDKLINIHKEIIIKIPYNENVDLIYKGREEQIEYMPVFECIGFWENKSKKLYGDIIPLQRGLNSQFFQKTILELKDEIVSECNILLDKYINDNLSILKAKGELLLTVNDAEIDKNILMRTYIYDNDIGELQTKININDFYLELKGLLLEYIQNPKNTVTKIFNDYINEKDDYLDSVDGKALTRSDRIGFDLAVRDLKINMLNEIKNNPDSTSFKKHNIIESIKDVSVNVITLTLHVKHNDTFVSFKYPYSRIYNFDFCTSYIKDLDAKRTMENLYSANKIYRNDFEFDIADIVSITYKKQTLYNDNSLSKETLDMDITDDLFG